jgi:signal peptidase I
VDSGPVFSDALALALTAPSHDSNPEIAAAANPQPTSSDGISLRRFLESAVIFFTGVILLRSIALEPFGVPTGSMAETLAGNHKECICPRCGHPVRVGSAAPTGDVQAALRSCATAFCPNCYQSNLGLDKMPDAIGDRLLVDKNIFEMRSPRRWEVAVFRCPSDLTKPYVKRVVALPNERVQILGGDIYINDELARKTLAECRSVRIDVFDNRFQPIGGGWKDRWRVGAPGFSGPEKSLADADEYLDGAALRWPKAEPGFRWLRYRHWLLDEKREEPVRDLFAYNGGTLRHELLDVHDFSVEFDLEIDDGTGEFAIGLTDGHDDVTAYLPVVPKGKPVASNVRLIDGTGTELANGGPNALSEGRSHRIELVFFDRRVQLNVDGHELFAPVDLPPVRDRKAVSRPVWLGVSGIAATVRNFRLFRDIHYSSSGHNGTHDPCRLGPDEYFMLGDNSANSEDSRYWTFPGVPERNFMGKPLLLHQPSRWTTLRGWDIQTTDWGRVRWIR